MKGMTTVICCRATWNGVRIAFEPRRSRDEDAGRRRRHRRNPLEWGAGRAGRLVLNASHRRSSTPPSMIADGRRVADHGREAHGDLAITNSVLIDLLDEPSKRAWAPLVGVSGNRIASHPASPADEVELPTVGLDQLARPGRAVRRGPESRTAVDNSGNSSNARNAERAGSPPRRTRSCLLLELLREGFRV